MKVTVHNVVISKDKMTKVSRQVWDWELPVLESRFPDGLVEVNGVTFVEVDVLPQADEVFGRMQNQYGLDEVSSNSHTDMVYGRGKEGIKALQKAIDGSLFDGRKAPAKKAKKEPKPATKAEAASKEPTDPLS